MITCMDVLDYTRELLAWFPVNVELDWFDDDTNYYIAVSPVDDDYDMTLVLETMKKSGFTLADSDNGTYFFA